jgi:hypothetical protein
MAQFNWGAFAGGLARGLENRRAREAATEDRKLKEQEAKAQVGIRALQEEKIRLENAKSVREGEGEARQREGIRKLKESVLSQGREQEMTPPMPDTAPEDIPYDIRIANIRDQGKATRESGLKATMLDVVRQQDIPEVMGIPGAGGGAGPRSFQAAIVDAMRTGQDPQRFYDASQQHAQTQMPGIMRQLTALEAIPPQARTPAQIEQIARLNSLVMTNSANQGYGREMGGQAAQLNMPSPTSLIPGAPAARAPIPGAPQPAAPIPGAPAPRAATPLGRPGETPRQELKRTDEEAQYRGKPLEAADRVAVTGLADNLKVAKTLKAEFTPEELTRFVGAIQNPMQRFSQLFRNPNSPEAVKFARFKALTDTVKGFAFGEGGKQLTETEKQITWGHLPIGNEFNLANYIANLDLTLSRTQGLIDGRLRMATTPRGQLGSQGQQPAAGGQGQPKTAEEYIKGLVR